MKRTRALALVGLAFGLVAAPAYGTPPVSGGGGDPHGSLPMDKQLGAIATWLGASPSVAAPAGVSPTYKPLTSDDPKMRAMEAYILAQRKGKTLEYGKH